MNRGLSIIVLLLSGRRRLEAVTVATSVGKNALNRSFFDMSSLSASIFVLPTNKASACAMASNEPFAIKYQSNSALNLSLLLSLLLLTLSMLLSAQPSWAQSSEEPINITVEEIMVTAQRRKQNLQSTGMTISVVNSDLINEAKLNNLPELTNAIPNVELFNDVGGAGLPTWVIRGVGLQDYNSNNTPTAAVYVDEGYQASVAMGGVGLFDVEQVEVLKGPQGGLYGRNTSAGAVRVNTKRATLDETSGFVRASLGSWQQFAVEAGVNTAISSNAAVRLSGRIHKGGGGWQKSITDNKEYGAKDLWDLRSWLKFVPSNNLSIDWKVQIGRDDSQLGLGRSIGYFSNVGGICDAIMAGHRDNDSCLNWAALNQILLGQGAAGNNVSLQSDNGDRVLSDAINRLENKYLNNLVIVRKQFQGFEMSSITSVDHFEYGVKLDLDASQGEFGHRFSNSDINVLSQEFRAVSDMESSLSWLFGVNFSKEKFEEKRNFLFKDNYLVIQDIGLSFGRINYDQDTMYKSIYGNVNYQINANWSVNSSLRYMNEDKKYRNGRLYIPLEVPLDIYANLERDYKLNENVSGSIGINWKLTDEILFYGLISQGIKSGGFYGGFPLSPEEIVPYNEEKNIAYELGFKSTLSNKRLIINGAIFSYDYRDVQGFVSKNSDMTNTRIDVLSNQGNAKHSGAELELVWRADENLYLNVAAGYLKANFSGRNRLTENFFGSRVPIQGGRSYSPKWSFVANADYQFSLTENFQASANISYHYRSEFSGWYSTLAEAGLNKLNGYGLLKTQLNIQNSNSNVEIVLWVDNVLQKEYITRVKHDGLRSYSEFFGEPRSMGIELKYHW